MDKRIIAALLIILLAFFVYFKRPNNKNPNEIEKGVSMADEKIPNLTITVIYDNYEYDKKLQTGWGFSCLVEFGDKNILFDTGGDSPTLLGNMEKLDIDMKKIDAIVLSHIHGDHVGGLKGVLKINPDVTVYGLKSFPKDFKDEIKSYGSNYTDVGEPIKIFDGVYTTGEMGTSIKEQSLVLKTDKGIFVVTGCAHPGIVSIVKKAKEITNADIYLVFGGFHLGSASDADLDQIINAFREMGVKKAGPCHCSGDRCRELFKEEYSNDFVEIGVGKIIEI